MYDLFRFMVLRPPENVDSSATISVDSNSDFLKSLREASHSQAPLASMSRVADSFTHSNQFVAEPSSLFYATQYQALSEQLSKQTELPLAKLTALIKVVFQADAKALVADKNFSNDNDRIQASLIALQLAAPPPNTQPDVLLQDCRLIDLLARAGQADPSLNQKGAIQQALNRFIVLPADLFPVPDAPAPVTSAPPAQPDPAQAGAGSDTTQQDLLNHATALYQALSVFKNLAVETNPPPVSPATRQSAQLTRAPLAPVNEAAVMSSNTLKRAFSAADQNLSNVSGIDAVTLNAFSPAVQHALSHLNLDLRAASPNLVVDRLNIELTNTMDLLSSGAIQKTFGPILSPAPDPFHEPPVPAEWQHKAPAPFPFPPSQPNAQIKPAGIADLLVVREHVLRYEPGEIAFVENVASGESFKRVTQRKNATESSTLVTTISSSETERDLQSTDRFGLQRESQSALSESLGSVSGAGISAAYGPLVNSNGSLQSSAAQVSNFGQDVTRRAVSKLTQSQETQVLQRSTTEFDERVEHNFDNSAKATDQIVIYQWLDKVIQARVFTYGKRMLYDIVVPEPAEFLVYEMQKWQPELAALQKPTVFSIQADQLSDNPANYYFYQYWAAGYGATGIQPPPEPRVSVARTYGNVAKDPLGNQPVETRTVNETGKDNVPIPDGYQAKTAIISAEALVWLDAGLALNIDIGQTFVQLSDPSTTPVTLNLKGEVGEIPLTVFVQGGPGIYTLAVEIVCERTATAMAQWQARTHDAILQASRDRLAEYEERFNTLKAALTIKLAGKSPDEKEALIRAELQKSCVSILSNQHFESFNAVEFVLPADGTPPQDYMPQLFLPNVEPMGRYIRFFQQAFEWDQMLYLYYPYFWGRRKYWNDRIQLDDQDPAFAAFLIAGAARVTVPVRPGYEQAVANFMNKGVVPTEADLLSDAVTTGLYVPFFAELMGSQGGPDTAVPYGTPPLEWEIRVPTTLVKVRTDNTLPKWASETWKAVNPGDSVNP